ncbi:hypothetical protein AAG570_006200 [Ranatra chinensis]|uniref:Uncharacterized protein n=1 Tax=Ranatra chinensis TaxID=642074 RepID=A0ABD0XXC2_9HEMI
MLILFCCTEPEAIRDVSKWSAKMREPLEATYGAAELQWMMSSWYGAIQTILEERKGEICGTSRLASIRSPSLVVHGELDPLVPREHPDHLIKYMPSAKLALLEPRLFGIAVRDTDYLLAQASFPKGDPNGVVARMLAAIPKDRGSIPHRGSKSGLGDFVNCRDIEVIVNSVVRDVPGSIQDNAQDFGLKGLDFINIRILAEPHSSIPLYTFKKGKHNLHLRYSVSIGVVEEAAHRQDSLMGDQMDVLLIGATHWAYPKGHRIFSLRYRIKG